MDAEVAAFVSAHDEALLRLAYLVAGDTASANDLVQEALACCCVTWRQRRADEPDAYARRVMAGVANERAEHDVLWRALQRAPPRQRVVLVVRCYEDRDEQARGSAQ